MTEQQHTTFPFYMATWYRKSPYYQRTVEAGCTSWDLYNHMLIPTLYDDDLKEYWHLLNHVTLWDVAVERQVEISGPDAARFTQLLTPRDLSSTQVGQCKYVLICAPDGGIVNDPILLKLAEDRFCSRSPTPPRRPLAAGGRRSPPPTRCSMRSACRRSPAWT